jgi:hypothetical protein
VYADLWLDVLLPAVIWCKSFNAATILSPDIYSVKMGWNKFQYTVLSSLSSFLWSLFHWHNTFPILIIVEFLSSRTHLTGQVPGYQVLHIIRLPTLTHAFTGNFLLLPPENVHLSVIFI